MLLKSYLILSLMRETSCNSAPLTYVIINVFLNCIHVKKFTPRQDNVIHRSLYFEIKTYAVYYNNRAKQNWEI